MPNKEELLITIGSKGEVKVEINKKEIPLKVRKDYLQMNEKVKTDEKAKAE